MYIILDPANKSNINTHNKYIGFKKTKLKSAYSSDKGENLNFLELKKILLKEKLI